MSVFTVLRRCGTVLSMLLCLSTPAKASEYPEPYASLLEEAREMESLIIIMPVAIFNLGNRLAEAPDPEMTAAIAEKILTRSPNKFVRRVGYTSIRAMKRTNFASIDLEGLILRGLDDTELWVVYDAIWAGESTGLDSPAFRVKLAPLAEGLDPSEYASVAPSDSHKQVQRRAGLLLQKLNKASDNRK